MSSEAFQKQQRTGDGRLILDYLPKLSKGFEEVFWDGVYAVAFQRLDIQAKLLTEAVANVRPMQAAARRQSRKEEYEGLTRSVASLLLLRDLLQIGWTMNLVGPATIKLTQPALHDNIDRAKQQIRDSMNFERQESLSPPSVRDFVFGMERARLVAGEERSIYSLIADGSRLAAVIADARDADEVARVTILQQAVRPYLQLVEGEARDPFTNLRLIDIWRYFRLTWSTPYRPTPGRNLFYLVRDAGQPCHPVIGIAALANCIIGLKCRDDRIGWTPDAIADRLLAAKREGPDELRCVSWEIAELLESHLEEGLAAISIDGITTRNEVAFPTEEGVERIVKLAIEAASDRNDHLRQESSYLDETFELVAPDAKPSALARDMRESSEALFRRKRTSKLATLLQAKLQCQKKNVFANPPVGLPELLWSDVEWTCRAEAGRSVLRSILNANKETKIGSSMMEITVCGAIKPYSYLLGGKLVAMMLASPEVVSDYAKRYGNRASTIASRVAGHDVTRDAQLVYLGTSSLYVGSLDKSRFNKKADDGEKVDLPRPHSASQYNRIRIPASLAGKNGEIRYEALGTTEGFGVVHFSGETREALEELDVLDQGMKRVNSMFGEGTSPRMRKIRQGMSLLALDDRYLVHGQERLVYGINLAHNTERYLCGQDTSPDYILPMDAPSSVSDSIARYWVGRWLASRINHTPAVEAVTAFLSREFAVSREYGDFCEEAPVSLGL